MALSLSGPQRAHLALSKDDYRMKQLHVDVVLFILCITDVCCRIFAHDHHGKKKSRAMYNNNNERGEREMRERNAGTASLLRSLLL
jgi:hypothetical protein